jgi:hypothetical protein
MRRAFSFIIGCAVKIVFCSAKGRLAKLTGNVAALARRAAADK